MKKRLSIKIVGHDFINAFANDDKRDSNKLPNYKGDGVAVWVYEYDETKGKPKEEKVVDA